MKRTDDDGGRLLIDTSNEPQDAAAGRPGNTTDHAEKGWDDVAKQLGKLVSDETLARWFKEADLEVIDENICRVVVPSETHVLWIEANYMPELTNAVSASLGIHGKPQLLAADPESTAIPIPDTQDQPELIPRTNGERKHEVSQDAARLQKKSRSLGLNTAYTFDRFVVGGNNQFAHAACKAVASGAKTAYNPLFIHGDSGLGKTHLMQAIGQEVLLARPGARVIFLTCEKFTNEFIAAVRKGELEKFRRRYRRADVMLVDDVQFLTGKDKSQEEFFHTFNTLLDGEAQVVLTSDRPASEIQTLASRLTTRFESGLTVALQPPRLETRVAILQRKMTEWDVNISDKWVLYIAERIRSNVRRLEGALVRVGTFTSLGQGDLSEERIEELLRDILREEAAAKVSIDAIQKTVAEHYDIRLADMTSRRRPANIAFPRQVAMYLSRKLTSGSLVEIGEAFGGRDHGTVIHACKKVESVMQTDARTKQAVDVLGARLSR